MTKDKAKRVEIHVIFLAVVIFTSGDGEIITKETDSYIYPYRIVLNAEVNDSS